MRQHLLICWATALSILMIAGQSTAESTIVLTYDDPCPRFAEMGRNETVKVAGVTVSLEPLFMGTCTYLKEQITSAVETKKKAIEGEFEQAAQGAAQELYVDFQHWMKEIVAAKLNMNTNDPRFEKHFVEWMDRPDREIEFYINAYLQDQYPRVHELVRRCQQDNSGEIIDGLQTLWQEARKKLAALNKAYKEIEANPNTPYTDILIEHGVSGPYLDRFQAGEHKFRVFNNKYEIVKAAKVMYDAFEAEDHRGKIGGLFKLLETVGDIAYRSDVPGVSLFGQIIKAYGQLATEMLNQIDGLERLIRAREGFCIGLATHTIEKERNKTFIATFGHGIRACPMDPERPLLKDIFQQAQPEDINQLYFWIEGSKSWIKGQAKGGGMDGVRRAQALIRDGASIGFTRLQSKDTDLPTISAFYNTPYSDSTHGVGLEGLWSEAVTTIDAIGLKLESLGRGLSPVPGGGCSIEDLNSALSSQCAVKPEHFPSRGEARTRLTISFAMGYIAKHNPKALPNRRSIGAYERYRTIHRCLKPLSVLVINGRIRESGRLTELCSACADAEVRIQPMGGFELPGCGVRQADSAGNFTTRIYTRSSNCSVRLSALLGDRRRSETITINRQVVSMDPYPFGFLEETFIIQVPTDDQGAQPPQPNVTPLPTPTPTPTPVPRVVVPDLGRMTMDKARAAVRAAGLILGAPHKGDPAPVDGLTYRVQFQTPKAGSTTEHGAQVEVTLFDVPVLREVEVPDLIGMTSEEARAALGDLNLTADIEITNTAAKPQDAFVVYAQAPLPGTLVEPWSDIHLKIWGRFDAAPNAISPTPTPVPPSPLPTPPPAPTEPPRQAEPPAGDTGAAPPVIVEHEPPAGPNWDLAGRWDSTRGAIFDMIDDGGGNYTGRLVRMYRQMKAFHLVPGDRMFSAVKAGPNHYAVKTYVKMGDGSWRTIGPITVIVDGETARAARLVWKRVKKDR
ncbi:MAG: PASTA domain-containing protein [Acidobacteriota bacterium]